MTAPVGMGGVSPWDLDMELNQHKLMETQHWHNVIEAQRESQRTGEPQVVTTYSSSEGFQTTICDHGGTLN